jgi:subtilisin-like proprotein convertase family protein
MKWSHQFLGLLLLGVAAPAAVAQMLDESDYHNRSGNTKVVALSDPTQSYELYVPTTVPATGPRSIVYAFDASGNGKNLMNLLAPAALDQGWIVAASNNYNNGIFDDFEQVYHVQDTLLVDTEARLNLHPDRRFATGFSGGSRIAMKLASRHPEKIVGVLTLATGMPSDILGPLNSRFANYVIIGRTDSNFFAGFADHQINLLNLGHRCFVQPIPGGHVYPSTSSVTTGFDWLATFAGSDYGPNLQRCDAGAAFNNSPLFFDSGYTTSQYDGEVGTFQYIGDLPGKISEITWWGTAYRYDSSRSQYVGCNRFAEDMRIAFWTDANGEPGERVWAEEVTPERVYSGHVFFSMEIYRYRYVFPEPLDVGDAKWLLLAGMPQADGCEWALEHHWAFNPPAGYRYTPEDAAAYFEIANVGAAICVGTDTAQEGEPPAPEGWLEDFTFFPEPGEDCGDVHSSIEAARLFDNQTVTSSIHLSGPQLVTDVNVLVDIRHTYTSDLMLVLTAPNGATSIMAAAQGGSGNNFSFALFDDEATTPVGSGAAPFTGAWQPDTPLSLLDGQPVQGEWKLEVTDFADGDTGALDGWKLQLNCAPGQEGEGTVEGGLEGEGATDGEGEGEGSVEGEGEGSTDGEGIVEGEGQSDGEGQPADDGILSADQNGDFVINLDELMRAIQLFNASGLHCAASPTDTEDGYRPGPGDDKSCAPHDTDYAPQNWTISLSELLRTVQFFNLLGYHPCPLNATEDGYCPRLGSEGQAE